MYVSVKKKKSSSETYCRDESIVSCLLRYLEILENVECNEIKQ